ncbi:MAG: hypothetical protein CSA95_06705 [Bacteroidetes bacterium]|nr:MAG: hypothetical protein CSA95_06705 [Bacteroidota bacterium]
MDLTKILSIAGKPGLYKMVANVKNGLIVESLIDQKRFPVFAHERISSLEEISIFTLEEDMPMKEVFKKISDHLTQHPEEKEAATAKEQLTLFETVIPNYDKDRVYSSHIKKIFAWYRLLQEKELLSFEEEEQEEAPTPEETSEK